MKSNEMKKSMAGLAAAAAAIALLGAAFWVSRAAAGEEGEGGGAVTSTFAVEGMTCRGCEAGVRVKVRRLAGVEAVEVSYRRGTARVTYDPAEVTPEQIITAIEELGYSAELLETETEAGRGTGKGWRSLLAGG
jgi:copper chaperone CopZ